MYVDFSDEDNESPRQPTSAPSQTPPANAVQRPAGPLQGAEPAAAIPACFGTLWSDDPGIICTVSIGSKRLRVFAISDTHIDVAANREWLAAHCPQPDSGCFHVLLLPGDLSDDLPLLRSAFRAFTSIFDLVVFTPGLQILTLRALIRLLVPIRS
jgi:hypothetical protein